MIICKIRNNAGPGNQMFMYAFAYALARRNNHKILIVSEISGYSVRQNILQYLNLDKTIVRGFIRTDWTKNQYIYKLIRKLLFDVFLKLPFFHQIFQPAKDSRVVLHLSKLNKRFYVTDGYWECHDYFDEYRNDLIKQFKPTYTIPDEVAKLLQRIKNSESVAVHIRKGDFNQFGRLINDDYYKLSIKRLRNELKNPVFFILSEDREVIEYYSKQMDCVIIEFNTPHKYIDEWYTMTQCKHHIIANSTYSWWSSYLAESEDKTVIIPDLQSYLLAEPASNEEMYLNYYRRGDQLLTEPTE